MMNADIDLFVCFESYLFSFDARARAPSKMHLPEQRRRHWPPLPELRRKLLWAAAASATLRLCAETEWRTQNEPPPPPNGSEINQNRLIGTILCTQAIAWPPATAATTCSPHCC